MAGHRQIFFLAAFTPSSGLTSMALGLVQALTQQASLLADLCFLTGSRDPASLFSLGHTDSDSHEPHSPSAP